MLEPNTRHLYLEALRPPTGFELIDAIGTTYSLDLETLLSVPLAMTLGTIDSRKLGEHTSIALLEAVRRAAGKLSIFCQAGRIAPPHAAHVLYGLLEPVVIGVNAGLGGVFHPKVWVLTFKSEDAGAPNRVRLLVLSRNITADRCWDISVCIEGDVTKRNVAANHPVGDFVAALPSLTKSAIPPEAQYRAQRVSEEVRRVQWELPANWESVEFHVLGLKKRQWRPPPSKRLLIVSPFVSAKAIASLRETTGSLVALVSRADELDKLPSSDLGGIEQVLVFDEAAESEDGEDTVGGAASQRPLLRGLHAKVYVAQTGRDTHICLGSANATDAALMAGHNVEFLAELTGKTSKVGGIDKFLDPDGMRGLLIPYTSPTSPPVEDPKRVSAEKALRLAESTLADAKLLVRFRQTDDGYIPTVVPSSAVSLPGIASVRAWLVSLADESAHSVDGIRTGESVNLASCAAASATGFVGFEIKAADMELTLRFVLNLPTENLPDDRDAQIIRMVIDNRDRFLAYLLAMLRPLEEIGMTGLPPIGTENTVGRSGWSANGLLEQLVRANARFPERIHEIRSVVNALRTSDGANEVFPPQFLEVWALFPEAP